MTVSDLRNKVLKLSGSRDTVKKNLQEAQRSFVQSSRELRASEEAQALIQHVAGKTQDLVKYHITELGSTALEAVFGDGIRLDLRFRESNGKTVADILFLRGPEGKPVDPLGSDSGGASDIASFALRCSLWSLKRPRTRPVIILDEPFKNINDSTRTMQKKAAEMVRLISDKLGIQFIIVTMLPELEEVADKVFRF